MGCVFGNIAADEPAFRGKNSVNVFSVTVKVGVGAQEFGAHGNAAYVVFAAVYDGLAFMVGRGCI